MDQDKIAELVEVSHRAKIHTYSPYSNIRVGAALLCENGTIVTGCYVENVSFGLGICAERTAILKAVSDGQKKFKAIAISSDSAATYISPCGACRQFMLEFGQDWDVYMTRPDLTYRHIKTGDLLPQAYSPDFLDGKRMDPASPVSMGPSTTELA